MFYEFKHPATVGYFKVEKGKDFSFPAHMHECFEFIHILTGKMSVTVNERVYEIEAGRTIMIFPNSVHSLSCDESEHLLCVFSPKLVSAFSSLVSDKLPTDPVFTLPEWLLKMFDETDDNVGILTKKGLLYSVCDVFDRGREYSIREWDNKYLLARIFSFIDKNYAEACDLKSLAHEINYDYAYLSRYFKASVGMSFNSYVNMYRLNNACYLFENTDGSILSCAIDSGFKSVRSFNRNFKKHFGITPNEYIKNKSSGI